MLDKAGIKVLDIIHFGGECTFARGKEIAQMASVKDADFLFAVGGGKAMDTVKVVAIELDDKPFFTIQPLRLLVRHVRSGSCIHGRSYF